MPKISELASGAPAVNTDALVIQRGGFNYSVTMENVAAFVTTDFASRDITVSGFWKYENQFVVNFQGDEWWWWNGFYVEAYDPTYTLVWSMAEDIPGGGTGNPDAGFAAALFSNTGSVAPYLEFDRARGTSGNPDFVDAGDSLGTIQWLTYTSDSGAPPFNAIARNTQATISVVVDEDRTTTGTDYESVTMRFQVADGAAPNTALDLSGSGSVFRNEQMTLTDQNDLAYIFSWAGLDGRVAAIDSVCDAGATQAFCYYSLEQGGGNSADNAPFFLFNRYNTGFAPLTVGHTVGKIYFQTVTTGRSSLQNCYEFAVLHEGPGGASGVAASLYFKSTELSSGSVRNRVRFDADGGIVTYNNSAVEATGGSKGAGTINCKGVYVDGVPANLAPTVVASLPAAATAGAGARGFATDATATTFHSIVAGGGANFVPVFSDGTNWRIG